MPDHVLTLRELNRATLARQMLLEREAVPVPDAIERLIGMQAQVPRPPYVGLWSRLRDFHREDLTRLVERRLVVRGTLMRSTLHLTTARDYAFLRPTLQPALTRALYSVAGKRLDSLDIEKLVAAARVYFEEEPRTFAELRLWLAGIEPNRDPSALAYAVRTSLPLLQIPSGGQWGYPGNALFTTAESWLGRPLPDSANPRELVRRYLAAFGPATIMDVQQWSGLNRLRDVVEGMRSELRLYRNEAGKELFDLPDTPLSPVDTPAPARFLPEFDNLLLSHADRSRIISDEYRKRIFTKNGLIPGTMLIDGFMRGVWRIEKTTSMATLVIEPFGKLSKQDRDSLSEEGERLVRFIEDGAKAHSIRFEMVG